MSDEEREVGSEGFDPEMDVPDDDADMSDDMSDDGEEFEAGELPEGVKKEVIKEAESHNVRMPKKGDEVTVHYVGTLESDGSEFDSSRGRGKPFNFKLGKGQVIKGWDLGVATMKKGEISKFTLQPEFAYGESGSPPKIPENATLVFEVELLSFQSKDDLFGDEGVIKSKVEEGKGWKTPKDNDEVLVNFKVETDDNTVVEERSAVEVVVGSDSLGPISKACNKALLGMKKGEKVTLKCTEEYSYEKYENGVTITFELCEIYETKDVSFGKMKTVMKKQVKEGEGYDSPKDTAKVTLSVSNATDGSAPIAGFTPQTLEFVAGNGEVCDALEMATTEMKKGEKSVLTISDVSLVKEAKLGLATVAGEKVVLTVELVAFEAGKETWDMSEEEKVEFGAARKEVGTALLKAGRLSMALERYKKVASMFSYTDNFKEENKEKANAIKLACELNKSAVYLKLNNFSEAKSCCQDVLKTDKQNIKALYRLGQAELGLKNFLDCIADCKKIVNIDAQNREARALLKQAQAGQKEEDKKAKGLFANMCKALGKGPIPEPGRSDENMNGGMSESDDDQMDIEKENANDVNMEKATDEAAKVAEEAKVE